MDEEIVVGLERLIASKDDATSLRAQKKLVEIGYQRSDFCSLISAGDGAFGIGEYDLAQRIYEKTLCLYPRNPQAVDGLAFTLRERGDLKGAVKYFEIGLEIAEKKGEKQCARICLANTHETLGELERAEKYLIEYATVNPYESIELADFYSRHGKQDEAIDVLNHMEGLMKPNEATQTLLDIKSRLLNLYDEMEDMEGIQGVRESILESKRLIDEVHRKHPEIWEKHFPFTPIPKPCVKILPRLRLV